MVFQWLIIPVALCLFAAEMTLWITRRRRLHLIKAMIWLCFTVCVWRPDVIQRLAEMTSVGRGADFLLYLLVVFSLLTTFFFLRQLEDQRRQITLLVRELSLQEQRRERPPVQNRDDTDVSNAPLR